MTTDSNEDKLSKEAIKILKASLFKNPIVNGCTDNGDFNKEVEVLITQGEGKSLAFIYKHVLDSANKWVNSEYDVKYGNKLQKISDKIRDLFTLV